MEAGFVLKQFTKHDTQFLNAVDILESFERTYFVHLKLLV